MKKLSIAMILIWLPLFVFASGQGENVDGPLRVGTQPNNLGATTFYAYEQGWFEEEGLEVELSLFPTGAPINEALAAQKLDVAVNGLASVYAIAAGDATWLGEMDITEGGMAVYVRPDSPILDHKGEIEDLPDMYGSAETVKGLDIIAPLGTAQHFNALTWAQRFGLTANDINILSMEWGPGAQAFLAGEADAIALPPPFSYQVLEAGMVEAGSLNDTSGIDLNNGVVARNAILEARPDDVQKFMNVLYRAQDVFAENDDIVYEFSMRFYDENGRTYTEEQMRQEMKERDFLGRDYFSDPDYRFGSIIVGMGEFYVETGKIEEENKANLRDGLDPSFLENVYDIDLNVFGQ